MNEINVVGPDIHYKVAETGDFEAIYNFCQMMIRVNARMSFVDVTSEAILWQWMEDAQIKLYLAEDGHRLVGMLRAKRGIGDQAHAIQIACAVDPEYRQRHIATGLTNFGLEDAYRHGVKIARTLIYDWNQASIRTIEKCGFKCSGRIPMVHYNPLTGAQEDDLVYYKRLDGAF